MDSPLVLVVAMIEFHHSKIKISFICMPFEISYIIKEVHSWNYCLYIYITLGIGSGNG